MATSSIPMLGEMRMTICIQGFQQDTPEEPYELLSQPGMADQAVLFHKPKWRPQAVKFQTGAVTPQHAIYLIEKARAMRRRKVKFFDGEKMVANCLVLAVSGSWRYAGIVLGPELNEGVAYEVTIEADLLPPAED